MGAGDDRREAIGGYLAHHGLVEWWLGAFTAEERERMAARYQPLPPDPAVSLGERPLTTGHVSWRTGSPVRFLTGLATWFLGRADRPLARRILAHAESLPGASTRDRFWLYATEIRAYYPDRATDPVAFATAIAACERQIALAPRAASAFRQRGPRAPLPEHLGYKQLAIIRAKQGRDDDAIALARQALAQGWAGDWERRIARLERRKARRGMR